MSLDLSRLEKVRHIGDKVRARCPACAEGGGDRAGNHLQILDGGRGPYRCVVDLDGKGGPHSKRIFEIAGESPRPGQYRPLPPIWRPMRAAPVSRIPPLRKLTVAELGGIATLRGWPSFTGLEILSQRGLLWHGMVYDAGVHRPAWIVTDGSRKNADARRFDGQPWTFRDGSTAKAKALVSGARGWPIGAVEVGDRPVVMLCEGQPDFCAAPLVAWFEGAPVAEIAFTCMAGAANDIHPDAFPYFVGKHVRIAVHDDEKGWQAVDRWARQLRSAGATNVDGVDFGGHLNRDGGRVEDLGHYAQLLDDENPPPGGIFDGIDFGTGTAEPNSPPGVVEARHC